MADTLNHRVRQLSVCVLTPTPTPHVPATTAEVFHNLFFPERGERLTYTYQLAQQGKARAWVLDSRGRRVKKLFEADLPRGLYSGTWEGAEEGGGKAASGLYVLRFELDGVLVMRKAVVLR